MVLAVDVLPLLVLQAAYVTMAASALQDATACDAPVDTEASQHKCFSTRLQLTSPSCSTWRNTWIRDVFCHRISCSAPLGPGVPTKNTSRIQQRQPPFYFIFILPFLGHDHGPFLRHRIRSVDRVLTALSDQDNRSPASCMLFTT